MSFPRHVRRFAREANPAAECACRECLAARGEYPADPAQLLLPVELPAATRSWWSLSADIASFASTPAERSVLERPHP